MLWLKTAWEWFKRNWQWVVIPIGVCLLLVRFLPTVLKCLSGNKPVDVVPSSLTDAAVAAQAAGDQAEQQAAAAERARQQQVADILKRHEQAVERLTDEQRAELPALEQDPERLNSFLLQVGRDMRG